MTYKKKHRFQEWYGDLKLQSKFTLALTLIVVIPAILVAVFFYSQLYDMVVSNTIRKEQEISSKTAPLIEETVSQVTDTYEELASLSFFKTIFHNPVSTPLGELTHTQDAEDFRKRVNEIADKDPVNAIRIYLQTPASQNSLFVSENTRDTFLPMSSARGTYWYGIFQGSHVTELFCPPFYLGTKERENCGDLAYIRKISINYYNNVYDAYVVLYYSSSAFEKILSDNLALSGSVSYIINDRNSTVASSNDSLSGIYWLDYESIQDAFMSSNNFVEQNILGETVYAGFYSITEPKWYMVTILPSQPLINQSNQIILQLLGIYLAILIFAIVLANFLARSITNRLSSVISQMKKVRQGPPVPMESPQAHDEIGDLIDTYNYMTRKMDELIQKQAKASEDLRIAEFNSLQAQINPHFLYNTMDMINWLALQGHTSEVSTAVQNLSRFYKLTLSRKKGISTIEREEEHVSIYISLQNMRYHDSIDFISDIPDELLEYQIPKLTLQPVIENAILHGILEKETKSGTIVLTGWLEDSDVVLLISDDGVGISPEKMPTILSGTGQSSSGGTNIAIYNTHRRLQILYGQKYGLTYTSTPGQGTEVQIRIPAKKES
jgi:two-component system sensor histidine kinase YesM